MLLAATDPAEVYEVHVNLIRHGRRLCTARAPACPECPLLEICPYGRRAVTAARMSAAELRVRVTPRAGRNEIAGERDGVVLVRVTAPPEGGKANAAACRVIARALGIAPSRVTVVRGAGSRREVAEGRGRRSEAPEKPPAAFSSASRSQK